MPLTRPCSQRWQRDEAQPDPLRGVLRQGPWTRDGGREAVVSYALKRLQVVSNELPDPPYPGDIVAGGWGFTLLPERIDNSDTWEDAPADMRPWLLMLWYRSWTQTPCGSLPNDDARIAKRIGMDERVFAANRDVLMRGWWRASDGRLYHHTVTELVLKMATSRRSTTARVQKWRNALLTRDQHVGNSTGAGTGAGTGTGTGIDHPTDGLVAERYRVPATPTQAIVDLFHKHLPELPAVNVLDEARKRATAARWRSVCAADKLDRDKGLEFFDWFFQHVRTAPWLMGQIKGKSGDTFRCTFDFLMTPSKFTRVVEGYYHRGKA